MKKFILLIIFFASLYSATFLQAQPLTSSIDQKCDCQVSETEVINSDQLLLLTEQEQSEAEINHFPFGKPTSSSDTERLIHNREYVINYGDELKIPIYASYVLDKEDVIQRTRKNCFRRDIRIPDDAASLCEDYDEPVFDRGHIVPRADMNRTHAVMINTFVFTNMAPQDDHFNRGVWRRLEQLIRQWAELKGDVYIITGSVFDTNGDGEPDSEDEIIRMEPLNNVAVPSHFYKIVLHERPTGFIENITILMPNNDNIHMHATHAVKDEYILNNLTTIDNIEQLTGLDFLTDLPDFKENAVERFKAFKFWDSP